MADVSTTRVEVTFRVIGSGLCNPEKDCCCVVTDVSTTRVEVIFRVIVSGLCSPG